MPFKNSKQRIAFFAQLKKKKEMLPSDNVIKDPVKSIIKSIPKQVQIESNPEKLSSKKNPAFDKLKKLMKIKKV